MADLYSGTLQHRWLTPRQTRPSLPDPDNTCDNRLYTPTVTYPASSALIFRQNFDLEQSTPALAFDCGVLEININGGGWQDILTAGDLCCPGWLQPYRHRHCFLQSAAAESPELERSSERRTRENFKRASLTCPHLVLANQFSSGGDGSDNLRSRAGWRVDNVSIAHRVCCAGAAPTVTSAVSRKTHGAAGAFNINLPLTGNVGVECRIGGATHGYTMVVTFANSVTVNGSPQAQVVSGSGTVGTGGASNGGAVTIAGAVVTIPLTNITNAQRIMVKLSGVNDGVAMGDVIIPMGILLGDTSGNASVNASDITQTKIQSGQTITGSNFRTDVNVNGSINASDVSAVKIRSGTSLP